MRNGSWNIFANTFCSKEILPKFQRYQSSMYNMLCCYNVPRRQAADVFELLTHPKRSYVQAKMYSRHVPPSPPQMQSSLAVRCTVMYIRRMCIFGLALTQIMSCFFSAPFYCFLHLMFFFGGRRANVLPSDKCSEL